MGKKSRKFKVKKGVVGVKDKIKILAYCDSPTCATGFGTVARNILMGWYNTGKYDIDILGINYWGEPHQYPFRIWPTGINNEKDPYGRQKVLNMIPKMDFDVLFVMQDSFILDFLPKLLQTLKAEGKDFVSICYFPVDATIKPEWLRNVMTVDIPVTYTQFAFNECVKVDPSVKEKLKIIPHGVDLNVFYPIKQDKVRRFREGYFSFQANKFIYMNLNRNQQRKDIPRTIMAFKEVRKKDPDTVLYLHCAIKDVGHELDKVIQSFGFSLSDVVFPQNFGPNQGFPIETVNMIYNAVDVVVSTTLGEGFGFCLGPDVNVYTESGIKTMKELTVEDKVLSSDGSYNEIEAIMSRNYRGKVYKILTWLSNIPILSSPEHGFLVYNNGNFEWKRAETLKRGDCLLFPRKCDFSVEELDVLDFIREHLNIRQLSLLDYNEYECKIQSPFKTKEKSIPRKIKVTEEFSKLLGLYLAEGSLGPKMDAVTFSFNKKESDAIEFVKSAMKNIFGLEDFYVIPDKRENYKGISIRFYSSVVAQFFYSLCGKGARTKKISGVILGFSPECLIKFIEGVYIGDGSYSKSNYEIIFSTTSKDVAYSLRFMLARLGVLSSVRTSRVEYKVTVTGISREKLHNLFKIPVDIIDRTRSHEKAFLIDDFLVFPIKEVLEEEYSGKLIDIQVARTNDFVAENVVVHNSWIEAMATKTPVIMPDNTAMAEYIIDDIGYLVRSGSNPSLFTVLPYDNEMIRPLVDVEHLAETMLHVKNNYDEALEKAENAYKFVKENLTWQNHIIPKWVNLLEKALVSDFNVKASGNKSNKVILTENF